MKKYIVLLIMCCVLVFGSVHRSEAFVFTAAGAAAASFGLSGSTALYASLAGHAAVIGISTYYGTTKYLEYRAGDENGTAMSRGSASDGTGIEGEVVAIQDLTAPDTASNVEEASTSTLENMTDSEIGDSVFMYNGEYMIPGDLEALGGTHSSAYAKNSEWYNPDLKNQWVCYTNDSLTFMGYDMNYSSTYDGTKDVVEPDVETFKTEYPEEFQDDNMVDTLRNDGQPHTYVGEIKDSPSREPDETLNITGNLGDGQFVTADGRVIDVSGHDTLESELNNTVTAEMDEDSISDIGYQGDDGSEGVMDSSTGDSAQSQGVNGDVTGVDRDSNTVYWQDGNGTEHSTSVDDETADDVADGVPDNVQDSWEGSGKDGNATEDEGLGITADDLAEAPGNGSVPNFDPSVSDGDLPDGAKEKQDVPYSEWKSYIPFFGVMSDSGFEVTGSDPVVNMHIQIATLDQQVQADFSQWSGILEMMGSIIYVVASFYAIRFALFD